MPCGIGPEQKCQIAEKGIQPTKQLQSLMPGADVSWIIEQLPSESSV
jgi:hypothetical protein